MAFPQPNIFRTTTGIENAAGAGIVYVGNFFDVAKTYATTTLTGDLSVTGDIISVVSATGFCNGDFITIGDDTVPTTPPEVVEILRVNTTTNKLSIRRNANFLDDEYLTHINGENIKKIAKRNTTTTSSYGETDTTIAVTDGSVFRAYDILRNKSTEERIFVKSVSGNNLTVVRDFTLVSPVKNNFTNKTVLEYTIASGDTLEVCAYGRMPDFEIGINEDVSITPSEDLIETMTNIAGRGAIFSQGRNYTISFTVAKTHDLALATLLLPQDTVRRNSELTGSGLTTDIGFKKRGIAVWIKPRAEETGLSYLFFNAIPPNAEETIAKGDQRQMALECMITSHNGLNTLGMKIDPSTCV